MDNAADPSASGPEVLWAETLKVQAPEQPTPTTSITAGRPGVAPDLVQRVLARAKRRLASQLVGTSSPDPDYVLGRLLGAGGMGKVYAATQLALERTVAVKVLRSELRGDEKARDDFLAEALLAAELDHPNTVPVYEIGMTDEGMPFYAMKLVVGSKWSQLLRTNTLEQNIH